MFLCIYISLGDRCHSYLYMSSSYLLVFVYLLLRVFVVLGIFADFSCFLLFFCYGDEQAGLILT